MRNKEYQPGDKVEVIIKSISDADRKVSLECQSSFRRRGSERDRNAAANEKIPEKLGSFADAFKNAEDKSDSSRNSKF
jgi:ribosomal protein S1